MSPIRRLILKTLQPLVANTEPELYNKSRRLIDARMSCGGASGDRVYTPDGFARKLLQGSIQTPRENPRRRRKRGEEPHIQPHKLLRFHTDTGNLFLEIRVLAFLGI